MQAYTQHRLSTQVQQQHHSSSLACGSGSPAARCEHLHEAAACKARLLDVAHMREAPRTLWPEQRVSCLQRAVHVMQLHGHLWGAAQFMC